MLNLTAAEYSVIALSIFLTFLFAIYPFIHLWLRRTGKIRNFLQNLVVSAIVVSTVFTTAYLTRSYALSSWVYVLPNGTVITVSHSSEYLAIADAVTKALGLTALFCAFMLAVFLLKDWLDYTRERTLGRRY